MDACSSWSGKGHWLCSRRRGSRQRGATVASSSSTGEPGIGKTSLVTRFVADLDADARVLLGACDDLSIPRPLGAIHDLAGSLSPALEEALAAGASPHEIHSLLLAELALPPQPTVLVLEDVHWADEATLDVITLLARRIGSLPVLLLLTCRDGEAPPGHPLPWPPRRSCCSSSRSRRVPSRRSRATAQTTSTPSPEATRSTSPSCSPRERPRSCRARSRTPCAVASRGCPRTSGGWSSSSRSCRIVSPPPCSTSSCPTGRRRRRSPSAGRCSRSSRATSRFRHELARNAIRSSIPIAARRRLHAEILAALLAADADPADIVHHAEAAGAEDVVADYALVAARRAAALDSNREAYSHYRRAAAFLDRLPAAERAAVLEELAGAAYAVYRLEDAFKAIERSIAEWAALGDGAAVGRCTQILSRFYWHAGDGDAARAKALEAIEILQPLGESVELARAYSGLAQLKNLAEYNDQALLWGERALELATKLGDERTRAHVLVNIASVKLDVDHRQISPLLEAHAFADEVGEKHEATRALGNLGYALMSWARPEPAMRYARQALAYAERERGAQPRLVHRRHARVAAAAGWGVGRGRAGDAVRAGEEHERRPARRQDGPGRARRAPRRRGRVRAARRSVGPGGSGERAPAASRRSSSWRPSGR